ncbi:hypothetical protein EBR66_07555 [bacterium]|nr:hypothetical protein [bacterium]
MCVKTLVEGKSFQEIRNSKEWLTTSETFHYILEHSLAASRSLRAGWYRHTYMDDVIEEEKKQLKNGCITTGWKVPYTDIYGAIDHVTVKDNAGNNVKFYNIGSILQFIQYQDQMLKNYEEEVERIRIRGSFYDPEWFS